MKIFNSFLSKFVAGAIAAAAFAFFALPAFGSGVPTVTTLDAVNVSQNSATLGGHETQASNKQVIVWIEYGTNPSLSGGLSAGYDVISYPQSSDTSFYASVSGLSPGATYYFRAVAKNTFGISYGTVKSFSTTGGTPPPPPGSQPSVITNSASGIGQTFAVVSGTVNPNSSFTKAWFEYGTSMNLGTTVGILNIGEGNSPIPVNFSLQNLTPNTTYYFRTVASNTYGTTNGSILSFTTQANQPQGSAPAVSTNSAYSVAQNSAVIPGTVNPNGSATDAYFEWGTSFGSLGNYTSSQSIGSGNGSVSVTASIFGLTPNSTYYYRIVAKNSIGTSNGSILSFTTLSSTGGGGGGSGVPSVNTNSATGISLARATVNGTVNTNGSFTEAWFDYGTTYSLANSIGHQWVGSHANTNFSFDFLNLSPNTTYYFRAAAKNAYGTGYGNILSFTTGNGVYGNTPSAITYGATSVTQTTAYLQGAASGNGYSGTAWFEWGPTRSLGNAVGQQQIGSGSGSMNYATVLSGLSPGTTYYFRAVAQTNFGTSQGSTFTFTTSQGYFGSGIPFVSTNGASFVETTSAQLNSTVDPRGSFTNARFEWGLTPSLGYTTLSRDMGSGYGTTQFSWPLTNLNPNTTYYYRVVAQNSLGSIQGAVVNFTTKSFYTPPPVTPPPAVQPTAPIISPSLVIEPRVNNAEPAPGGTITYSLRYRNGNSVNSVSSIVVRIILPDDIEFVSGSLEPASQTSRELSFNLGSLSPGSDGELSLKLLVSKDANDGDSLVIGAVADWRDASNRSQSTSAYLTLTVNASGFLAALLGLDIPLGWILVVIAIGLITFFAARKIGRKSDEHSPSPSHFTFKRSAASSSH